MNSGRRRRGSSVLEMTLVGVPLMFLLITSFELSRGMWLYHTLAFAVKEGTRYAVVHGQDCALPPNSCTVTISNIATVIQNQGGGLTSSSLSLTFTDAAGNATTCLLSACIANYTTSAWPNSSNNAPGLKIKISGTYPFSGVVALFWPGASRALGGYTTVNLYASSRESIQF
jgi:Flp pilus assembly protein TadG